MPVLADLSHNVTLAAFKNAMGASNLLTALPTGHVQLPYEGLSNANRVAVNETAAGAFDSLCFAWFSYDENSAFEVSDFDYAILS